MLFVQRARHAAAALAKTPVHARTLASLPDQGPEVVSGLQPSKVDAANKLGFKEDEGIVAFGAGAVNNTLLALMSQVSSNLSLVSRYADDIEKDGVTLHHRGDEYVVPAGDIKLPQTSVIKEFGEKIASPRIVLNGRQLGGDGLVRLFARLDLARVAVRRQQRHELQRAEQVGGFLRGHRRGRDPRDRRGRFAVDQVGDLREERALAEKCLVRRRPAEQVVAQLEAILHDDSPVRRALFAHNVETPL